MPELVVRDLVVEYSSGGYLVRPIDGLDVTIRPGSLALLMGPSGCGKTTLLSCIGAILKAKSGTIRFGGFDVTLADGRSLARYRREQVGFVFQAFNLVPSLSALENVMVPLWASGIRHRRARDRAAQLLERVGLAEHLDARPGNMSGGQQQRVALARALALDPPVILADEPTAHLDFIQVEDVLRLLRELATGERLVIAATHDQRIIPLADDVIEMFSFEPKREHEPKHRDLAVGEIVFRQGDVGDLIYVIAHGAVDIVRERTDGSEDLVAVKTDGEYFGEMGPLCGIPRSATARTRIPTRLVAYTAREFRSARGPRGVGDLLARHGSDRSDS